MSQPLAVISVAESVSRSGALAVALLDDFRTVGAFCLASTHLMAVKVYGAKKVKRLVNIRSITFLAPDTAQVRFTALEKLDTSERPSYWIATLQFRFVQNSADEEERLINPVGFKITSYRIDPEVTK